MLVAAGAVLAIFLMPGWWWITIALVFVVAIMLGVANGLGVRWAGRLGDMLFWTRR